jgi:hypothetical protein
LVGLIIPARPQTHWSLAMAYTTGLPVLLISIFSMGHLHQPRLKSFLLFSEFFYSALTMLKAFSGPSLNQDPWFKLNY